VTLTWPARVLSQCDASGADFAAANLTNAELPKTIVTGASFRAATLTGVLSPVVGTPSALPAHWALVACLVANSYYLAGPGANLAVAQLYRLDLRGLDLVGASLRDAILFGADLAHANLTGAQLQHSDFQRRYKSQPPANLTDANLTRADLKGSSLAPGNAKLTGVKWLDATCPNGVTASRYTAGCFSKRRA
jgi:uncharacterized protein YjbI with pentapeptide repeats